MSLFAGDAATGVALLAGARIETLCLRPSCFVLLSPQFGEKFVDETEEDDVVSSGVYEPEYDLLWKKQKKREATIKHSDHI